VRRLFQAAVEIIKKKPPKASFVDFHGCGSFHKLPLPQLSFFFAAFFFLYSRLECPDRGLIRALASWKIASSFWSIFFDSSNGSCVLNVWSSCASFTPSACPHSRTRSSGVFGGS